MLRRWFPRRQAGFTLPELVAAVALVALIAGIATPGLVRTLESVRLRAATQRFASDIRLAQGRAQRYARPVRLVFETGSGAYRIEQAQSASAPADCTTAYDLVATVDLQAEYQAVFRSQTVDCIVFEPSGRPGWSNPIVLSGLSTATSNNDTHLPRYLNGATATVDSWIIADAQTIYWRGKDEIIVTVDLGAPVELEWICPSIVSTGPELDDIPFPHAFRLEISDLTGAAPPSPTDWTLLERVEAPYHGTYTSETGQWHTACPKSALNRPLRYLRYLFEPAESDLWGVTAMALDEIKLSPPSVTLTNLSGKIQRKVTVARITGKVSHE